jgi:hypothetical protein
MLMPQEVLEDDDLFEVSSARRLLNISGPIINRGAQGV